MFAERTICYTFSPRMYIYTHLQKQFAFVIIQCGLVSRIFPPKEIAIFLSDETNT